MSQNEYCIRIGKYNLRCMASSELRMRMIQLICNARLAPHTH